MSVTWKKALTLPCWHSVSSFKRLFFISYTVGLLKYCTIILLFDDPHTSEKNRKKKKSIPDLYLLENVIIQCTTYLFNQNAHEMSKAKTMKKTPCDRVVIFPHMCEATQMNFSLVKCASLQGILSCPVASVISNSL